MSKIGGHARIIRANEISQWIAALACLLLTHLCSYDLIACAMRVSLPNLDAVASRN
jgi:hypothetical protein